MWLSIFGYKDFSILDEIYGILVTDYGKYAPKVGLRLRLPERCAKRFQVALLFDGGLVEHDVKLLLRVAGFYGKGNRFADEIDEHGQ